MDLVQGIQILKVISFYDIDELGTKTYWSIFMTKARRWKVTQHLIWFLGLENEKIWTLDQTEWRINKIIQTSSQNNWNMLL